MDTSGPEPRESKQAGEELLSGLLKWRGGAWLVANSGGGFHHHQWGSDMTSSESRVAKNSRFRFPRSEEEPFLREGGGKNLEV